MQGAEIDRNEEVRQLAYGIWLEEGCPEGREAHNWVKAETIWEEKHRPQSKLQRTASSRERKARQRRTTERVS